MRIGVLAGALALMAAETGHAMMAPHYYEAAREAAAFHLQVTVTGMTPAGAAIGTCRVEAAIGTVLRDASGRLAAGDAVVFDVDCLRVDADPNQIPDCVLFERVEDLVPGVLLEVYLDRNGLGYVVAAGQVEVIGTPAQPAS